MPIRVLIADDSTFIRRRLIEIIGADRRFEIAGEAENGRQAVEKVMELQPDVVTMDYEMPVLNGLEAVRAIMKQRPTPILMFSSLTYDGAKVTMDALDAGAVDFIPKNFAEVAENNTGMNRHLLERLRQISHRARVFNPAEAEQAVRELKRQSRESEGGKASTTPAPAAPTSARAPTPAVGTAPTKAQRSAAPVASQRHFPKPQVLVIGSSTGGPVALAKLLPQLPANFPVPIVLIQHMPANFTRPFAERLNQLSQIAIGEAADGDRIGPGRALLAPGGRQLMLHRGQVKIVDGDERVHYKPSVDIAFASAAKHYGKDILGVVLTGMGSDGCEGAKLVRQSGGHIWSQDEASSVIYGMPQAVARAGVTEKVVGLEQLAGDLIEVCC